MDTHRLFSASDAGTVKAIVVDLEANNRISCVLYQKHFRVSGSRNSFSKEILVNSNGRQQLLTRKLGGWVCAI